MALSPWQLCFHTDLKCRVSACNSKRVISNTVFSPYCRHHVCTICLKQKTFFKRGHGEERICRHHSCTHPSCHAPRSKKHPNAPFCSKHACAVRSCDQPRQAPGHCCRRHTCRGRGCVNCVHPPSPPPDDPPEVIGSEEPTHRYYCPGHQPCQAPGCPHLAFADPAHRARRYCFRHHCAAAAGCEGQRVDAPATTTDAGAKGAAQACRDHTCALYPSCARPRADASRGLFCKSHECAEAACQKQRYETGLARPGGGKRDKGVWCADHMCLAALARQEECGARREGTPANPLYCADHELCGEPGCAAFCAVRGRGVRLETCEEHLKSKCAFPACPLDAEGGVAACRYHVCRADGCLAQLAPTIAPDSARTSLFCDAHRCVEPECGNARSATASASTAGTALPPHGVGDGGGAYCAEHVYRQRMGVGMGMGLGLCPHGHGAGRHAFGGGCGGMCCRWRGGSSGDDDDDSDDDDTITDHGGSSSTGLGPDISPCFCHGGADDCGSHGKKCHKCVKC
ncbi:hypothetical protein F4781DRAFT_433517 [Annulohypoxylon bovei var. microspora]|nr:hypothetical protein F4781DRAFT_433517 [Annulohypoxylon bovei var. microspora]